ncbi:hypothetical protein ABZ281_07655 [Streptomyces sp. NPDC006265]|uniref:hypothetical protein n=1 Tax=Streptomyces sp. NPDC006265 TaxID=3156740 RepID=UPI0033A7A9BC
MQDETARNVNRASHQGFMERLREQWEAQPTEQHEFLGLTGMDYNDWLEHRHAWPVDADGNCRIHSELEEFPAKECRVCSTLIKRYEQEYGVGKADAEELRLEIARLERRLGEYEIAVKRLSRTAPNGEQVLKELDEGLTRANDNHHTEMAKLTASRAGSH